MFSGGVVLHCCILSCHFVVLYCTMFIIDSVADSELKTSILSMDLWPFQPVGSFTSTWLHTTWAFSLKWSFFIFLGLFVIVILLCDFF